MKIKPWLTYFIYIALLLLLIVLRAYVEELFSASYYRYESATGFYYVVISIILGVCIGSLLGLESFMKERRTEGTWKVNLPRLILVGVPALYFSLTNLWFLSGSQFLQEIIAYPSLRLFRYGSSYVSIFQIILGYVVATSFFKHKESV